MNIEIIKWATNNVSAAIFSIFTQPTPEQALRIAAIVSMQLKAAHTTQAAHVTNKRNNYHVKERT